MLTSLIASYYNLLTLGYKQCEGRSCYRTYNYNNLQGIIVVQQMHACSVISVESSSLQPQWTIARQAPLSMGFSRQEHWSGLPCRPPGDLPDPGISRTSPVCPALQADSSPLRYWEAPTKKNTYRFFLDIAPGSAAFTLMGFLHTKNIFITIIPV